MISIFLKIIIEKNNFILTKDRLKESFAKKDKLVTEKFEIIFSK